MNLNTLRIVCRASGPVCTSDILTQATLGKWLTPQIKSLETIVRDGPWLAIGSSALANFYQFLQRVGELRSQLHIWLISSKNFPRHIYCDSSLVYYALRMDTLLPCKQGAVAERLRHQMDIA